MKERNYNIDFLRGIATICIIIIHTAFWSGVYYLPKWFSNLTLLVDVPVFIFISGIACSYSKTFMKKIKGLLDQWKKWLFFLVFYVVIILIFFRSDFSLKNLFSWMFYIFPKKTNLVVVQGSIWFIFMYIKVTIVSSAIICLNEYFEKKKNKQLDNLVKITGLIAIVFCYVALSKVKTGLDKYTLFYSGIYLLGYISTKYKINLKQLFLYQGINLLLLIIVFYGFHLTINDFQNIKFPPSFPYIFVSMPSIILFWYLKDHLKIKKNNPINYIGQNALLFYFVQGISSSLLLIIMHYLPLNHRFISFGILLVINIVITTLGAIILEKSYNFVSCKINTEKLKKIFLPNKKKKNEL